MVEETKPTRTYRFSQSRSSRSTATRTQRFYRQTKSTRQTQIEVPSTNKVQTRATQLIASTLRERTFNFDRYHVNGPERPLSTKNDQQPRCEPRPRERLGSAMPEQVTMTPKFPDDRGLSCIPLFESTRLEVCSIANPHWPLRWSAIRPLTNSVYEF
jgi:hypothetical protein